MKLCYKALDKWAPHTAVSCDLGQYSNRNKNIKIILNNFFNNLQELSRDTKEKQQVISHKKLQRNKEEWTKGNQKGTTENICSLC